LRSLHSGERAHSLFQASPTNTDAPAKADLIALADGRAGFRISVSAGLGYGSKIDIQPVLIRIG
jgi:hypothetical protein